MSKKKKTKEQRIVDCAAGKIATGFRQDGSGGCRVVLYFCNLAACPRCGKFKAKELMQRVAKDMAAKGARRLTRIEIEGNLGTDEGKKLRKKLNKAMREGDALYTIMPHGDTFIMHIVGSLDGFAGFDNLTISSDRMKAKDVDWFRDCQTIGNKSGTLGKKDAAPAPGSGKPTTKIAVPEPKFRWGLNREQLMDAIEKAINKTASMFDALPAGGDLDEDEKSQVGVAYQLRAELMEEAVEEQGGKVIGHTWRTVFYSGNSSKKLSRSDCRELIPAIPDVTKAAIQQA